MSASEADDVVQDAWLAALTTPPRHGGSLRGWLYTITRFAAFRHHRQEERRRMREGLAAGAARPPAESAAAHEDQRLRALSDALAALKEPYGTVVRLRYIEELSLTEICARLERPEATVKSQLQRGLALLRRRLGAAPPSSTSSRSASLWALLLLGRRRGAKPESAGSAVAGASYVVVTGALVGAGFLLYPRDAGPRAADEAAAQLRDRPSASESTSALAEAARATGSARVPAESALGTLLVEVLRAGAPVADVPLFLEPVDLVSDPARRLSARTASDGRARCEDLAPGRWRVDALLGSGAFAVVERGRETRVEIVLESGLDVTGIVRRKRDPVPGAGVWLSLPGRMDVGAIATYTDATGRFELHDVNPLAWIGATQEGARPPMLVPLNAPGTKSYALPLGEAPEPLRARVLDENGAPIIGALVRCRTTVDLMKPDWSARVPYIEERSGPDGSFELAALSPAAMIVTLEAPGFAPESVEVCKPRNVALPAEIRLCRGVRVEGRVVDGAGVPKAEARVVLDPGPPFQPRVALSDAEGRFAVDSLGRRLHKLRVARADDPLSLVQELDLRAEPARATVRLSDLVLGERDSIQGSAADERGEALAGWTVQLVEERDAAEIDLVGRRQGSEPRSASTGPRGEFAFGACDGGPYLVRLLPPEGGAPRACLRGVAPGRGPLALVCSPEVELAGLSGWLGTAGDAAPVAPGTRALLAAPIFERPLQVDVEASGAFRFAAVPPGAYALFAWSPELEPIRLREVELVAGRELQLGALELPAPGAVAGVVRFAAGSEPESYNVQIASSFIALTALSTRDSGSRIHADGSFRFENLAPGEYTARLIDKTTTLAYQRFRVAPGETARVELVANGGTHVELAAAYAGLLPAASRVSIEVLERESGERRVCERLTADHASEPLRARWVLPPGAYRVLVTSDVGIEGAADFDVGLEPELSVEVELRRAEPSEAASSSSEAR